MHIDAATKKEILKRLKKGMTSAEIRKGIKGLTKQQIAAYKAHITQGNYSTSSKIPVSDDDRKKIRSYRKRGLTSVEISLLMGRCYSAQQIAGVKAALTKKGL